VLYLYKYISMCKGFEWCIVHARCQVTPTNTIISEYLSKTINTFSSFYVYMQFNNYSLESCDHVGSILKQPEEEVTSQKCIVGNFRVRVRGSDITKVHCGKFQG